MPLFQQFVCFFGQKLEILPIPQSRPQLFGLRVKKTRVHYAWNLPDFIAGLAEFTPLVQEISGDNVIYSLKFILLKSELLLEFLKKLLVVFVLFGQYSSGGPEN